MNYIIILRVALGIAKQLQVDHPDVDGLQKLGMLTDLLTEFAGAEDVSKYKNSIESIVTLMVTGWKMAGKFGFTQKISAAVAGAAVVK